MGKIGRPKKYYMTPKLGNKPVKMVKIQPVVGSMTTYADWLNSMFSEADLLDETISGLMADPDGDGLANFAEYGLAKLPKMSDAGSLLSVSQNELSFQQRSDPREVAVSIQNSQDLTTWTVIDEKSITRAPNGDGITETVTWPIVGTQGYLRLSLLPLEVNE